MFLSVLGKRLALSLIDDILVESEAVVAGSMKGVIGGHMCNRSIRAYKLLFEALGRFRMDTFLDTCSEEVINDYKHQITWMGQSCEQHHHIAVFGDLKVKFHQHLEEQCKANQDFKFGTLTLELCTFY